MITNNEFHGDGGGFAVRLLRSNDINILVNNNLIQNYTRAVDLNGEVDTNFTRMFSNNNPVDAQAPPSLRKWSIVLSIKGFLEKIFTLRFLVRYA